VAIAQLLSGRHFGNNKDQEPGISAKKKRCRDEQKESDSRLAKVKSQAFPRLTFGVVGRSFFFRRWVTTASTSVVIRSSEALLLALRNKTNE